MRRRCAPLRGDGDGGHDEPFLTVKLDVWWVLESLEDFGQGSEGVDIDRVLMGESRALLESWPVGIWN